MIRLAALLMLGAIGAQAQQGAPLEQAIGQCAGIASRLDRLDCYDAIPPSFDIAVVSNNSWVHSTRPDSAGGPPLQALTLTADSGTSGFGEPVQLIALCRANTTEVFIHWHEYLGADGAQGDDVIKQVTLTIDDGPPETGQWPISDDVEATFTPEWGGTLLRQLAGAQQMTAQITPYDQRTITAMFNVQGLAQAIEPLTSACNWEL